MGVLFENRVVENYNNSFLSILTEISQNEKEIFSENLEIVNESFEDIKNKVVNFIKKIKEAINRAYNFLKNKLLNVSKNINKEKMKDFSKDALNHKCKFREPKSTFTDSVMKNKIAKMEYIFDATKSYQKLDNDSILQKLFEGYSSNLSLHDNLVNYFFEEEKEYEHLSSNIISFIEDTLTKPTIILDNIDKQTNVYFEYMIKSIEKSTPENDEEKERCNNMIHNLKVCINLVNLLYDQMTLCITFNIKQCTRIYKEVMG